MNTSKNKAQAVGAQVAQHTPGPWHVPSRTLTGLSENIVWNQAGQLIAACDSNLYIDAETKKANARLIAAAPELLEALKALEEIGSLINARQHADVPVRPDDWSELYHCCGHARAAIAKAEAKLQQ